MWIWLLLAAVSGGLIGWGACIYYSSRKPKPPAPVPGPETSVADLAARIAELEARLATSLAEAAELRVRSGIPLPGQEGAPPPEGSLAWRNRHLEARVRYLEGKLADGDAGGSARPREEQADEATRLRWRTRYLEGRVKYLEEEMVRTGGFPLARPAASGATVGAESGPKAPDGAKPPLLDSPRDGRADDLKQISGIGPKLEQKLNSLGIWHIDQIANWTPAEMDWVNAAISFRSRVERERWVPQARQLLQGAPAASGGELAPAQEA